MKTLTRRAAPGRATPAREEDPGRASQREWKGKREGQSSDFTPAERRARQSATSAAFSSERTGMHS